MRAAAAAQPPAAAGARRPRRLLPLLLLALAAAAGRLPGAAAQTLESDKAALLAFKASLADDGGDLLAGWSEYSDPCVDSWRGVACTCFAFYEGGESAERLPICTPLQDDSEGQRVLQVGFAGRRGGFGGLGRLFCSVGRWFGGFRMLVLQVLDRSL
jgi:hypothetical protein